MKKLERINIPIDIDDKIIKANNKYIISIDDIQINISIFQNNEIKNVFNKSFKFLHNQLELSKIYDNIFLTISGKVINIFEISESMNNYELENKLRIEAKDDIIFAKFSEHNEKIIGAVSENNVVRLWNIDSNFNFITIKPKCDFVKDFLFNKDKNLLIIQGYYLDHSYEIYVYDIKYEIKTKKTIKRKNKDYIYEISEIILKMSY